MIKIMLKGEDGCRRVVEVSDIGFYEDENLYSENSEIMKKIKNHLKISMMNTDDNNYDQASREYSDEHLVTLYMTNDDRNGWRLYTTCKMFIADRIVKMSFKNDYINLYDIDEEIKFKEEHF